jgi:release factor glutamine methyltransferase
VKNYDPHLALFAGHDGLEAYRAIAAQAQGHLKPEGKVILEIGYDQAASVTAIFVQHGFGLIDQVKDLGGRDRGLAFSFVSLK